MNQLLLECLDARAWRANPEGENKREAPSLGGIFAHLRSNRTIDQKLGSPSEASCAARPRASHNQADKRSSSAKRDTLPGDAEEALSNGAQTCDSMLTREMGAQLACEQPSSPYQHTQIPATQDLFGNIIEAAASEQTTGQYVQRESRVCGRADR
jgi:hypothetical protein